MMRLSRNSSNTTPKVKHCNFGQHKCENHWCSTETFHTTGTLFIFIFLPFSWKSQENGQTSKKKKVNEVREVAKKVNIFPCCYKKVIASVFPQSLLILGCSIWPAGACNPFLGGAWQCVLPAQCTPKKCKSMHPPRGSRHPENWARIARTVFSQDARNRAQTKNYPDANLSPQKKFPLNIKLNNFLHCIPTILENVDM